MYHACQASNTLTNGAALQGSLLLISIINLLKMAVLAALDSDFTKELGTLPLLHTRGPVPEATLPLLVLSFTWGSHAQLNFQLRKCSNPCLVMPIPIEFMEWNSPCHNDIQSYDHIHVPIQNEPAVYMQPVWINTTTNASEKLLINRSTAVSQMSSKQCIKWCGLAQWPPHATWCGLWCVGLHAFIYTMAACCFMLQCNTLPVLHFYMLHSYILHFYISRFYSTALPQVAASCRSAMPVLHFYITGAVCLLQLLLPFKLWMQTLRRVTLLVAMSVA